MIGHWLGRWFGGTPSRSDQPAQPVLASVPLPASAAAYRALLDAPLAQQTDAAVKTLRAVADGLPPKAKRIDIGIHPSQEGEGSFSILVHLDGPDLYVLNKAIADHRYLFDLKSSDMRSLGLPSFGWREEDGRDWEVNDVIADAAADWVETVWRAAQPMPRPGVVFADEGWGDTHRPLPGGEK